MKADKVTGLVALTLLRAHAQYNAGETAGFLPDMAAKLIAAGGAVPYDPNAKIELPAADSSAAVADLAARAADLDAREKALAEREAAIAAAVSPKVEAGAGEPPKQGGK